MSKTAFSLCLMFFLLAPRTGLGYVFRTCAQEYYPKFYREDGEMRGYGIDIIHALERTDKNIQFIGYKDFCTIPRIENDLVTGSNDIFIGAFKTPSREKQFYVLEPPLHYFRLVMVVRKNDDVKVANFKEILALPGDKTVLTLFGSGLHQFLNEVTGLQIDSSAVTLDANLSKLQNGHGRFFFTTDLGIESALLKPQWKGKFTVLHTTFKKEGQYVLASRNLSAQNIDILKKGLRRIRKSGELKRIFAAYTKKESLPLSRFTTSPVSPSFDTEFLPAASLRYFSYNNKSCRFHNGTL